MSNKRVLVILGTRQDSHVDRVASEIEKIGGTSVLVIDYLSEMRFRLEMTSSGHISIYVDDVCLPANIVIWNRSKILAGTELYTKGDETSSGYSAQEWRALYTLLGGLNPGLIVNSMESRQCLIKPYQQTVAASVGFLVPPTLVTNDKNAVMRFFKDTTENLILKSLSGGKIKPPGEGESIPYNIMTMRVAA